MNGRFLLVPIGALDLDRAARLHELAFAALGERPWTRQDIAELLGSPSTGGLLVTLDGEDAALALWRATLDEAELLTIGVKAKFQRQGIGRTLLAAVVERVRLKCARVLFLEVGVDNPAALSLYAQAGFEQVGRRAAYYQRPVGFADALILRRRLSDGG